jgi:MFS family permease
MLFAPLSEVYGRKISILPAFFVSACFAFATATAMDPQTIFISRFFCGFFGSAPIAVTAGSLSDIWPPKHRGKAMTAYALAVIVGPLVAPIVGSAFVTSSLGWRWTEYVRD